MPKVKKVVTVKKCQCSTCEQVSFVEVGKPHHYCKGIPASMIARMPAMFKDLTNPKRQGVWVEMSTLDKREIPAQPLQDASGVPASA
jgi:hypothetical protein